MRIYSKLALVIGMIISICSITSCTHTAQGFGQDMEHTGKQIQKAASGN